MNKGRSNPFSKWNKRWFILREDRLMYFKSKTEVDPRRVYFLKDVSSAEEVDERTLLIRHSVGNIILQSLDETISQWKAEIQKAIEKVQQEAITRKSMKLRLRSGTIPRLDRKTSEEEEGTVPTPKEAFLEHCILPDSPRSWTDKSPRLQNIPLNRRSLTLTPQVGRSIELLDL